MRFEQYSSEVQKMYDTIKRDCNKYLKEIGTKKFLVRGSHTKENNGDSLVKIKSHIETGRKPKATSWATHKLLNMAGTEVFGWPFRDGVPTGSNYDKKVFGPERIFLPIGDYKYVYSVKIFDFNWDGIDTLEKYLDEHATEEQLDVLSYTNSNIMENFKKVLPLYVGFLKEYYTDKNLQYKIRIGGEVFVKCDEYYLVQNKPMFDTIIEEGDW